MIITIIILFAIALIHFYWAVGGDWGIDKALPTDSKGNRLLNPPQPLSALVGLVVLGLPMLLTSYGKEVVKVLYSMQVGELRLYFF